VISHTETQTPLAFMSLVNCGSMDGKTIDVVLLSTDTNRPEPYETEIPILIIARQFPSDICGSSSAPAHLTLSACWGDIS